MNIILLLFLCGTYLSAQVPTNPKNIVLLFGSSGITPITFLSTPNYQIGTNDSQMGAYAISPVSSRIIVNFVFQLPVLLSTISEITLDCNFICESNGTRNWTLVSGNASVPNVLVFSDSGTVPSWSNVSFLLFNASTQTISEFALLTTSVLTVQFETSGTADFVIDYLALVITGTFNNTSPASQAPTIQSNGLQSSPGLRPPHWVPALGLTWQWPVVGTDMEATGPARNVFGDVIVQDLFYAKQESINNIHAAGSYVMCSFSVGSWERNAPDADRYVFEGVSMGESVSALNCTSFACTSPWQGESWLDIRQIDALATVIGARMDLAAAKACDAVAPLLMNSYEQVTGFALTAQDQFQYNRLISQLAHDRGLAVGLTNDFGQTQALAPYFDLLVALQPLGLGYSDIYYSGLANQNVPFAEMNEFIRLNKPVYVIEYAPVNCSAFFNTQYSVIFSQLNSNLYQDCGYAPNSTAYTSRGAATPSGWVPAPDDLFFFQTTGMRPANTNYVVQLISLFDVTQTFVNTQHQSGAYVVCFFSAGLAEPSYPDFALFLPSLLGVYAANASIYSPGGYWLDIRSDSAVLNNTPLLARFDQAASVGCDGVLPLDVNLFEQPTSPFTITPSQQLAYNQLLAQQAHQRGMSIGLDDMTQAASLVTSFDFAWNRDCSNVSASPTSCDLLLPFAQAKKPVFGVQSDLNVADFCPYGLQQGYSFQRQIVPSTSGSYPCASPKPLIQDLTQFGSVTANPLVLQLFDTAGQLCSQIVVPQGSLTTNGNNTLFAKIESKAPLVVSDPIFAQTNIFGVFWNENAKLINYTFCVATGAFNTSNVSALCMIQLNSDTASWSQCVGSPLFFVDASNTTNAALLTGYNVNASDGYNGSVALLACANFTEPTGMLIGRRRGLARDAGHEKRVFVFGDSQGYFYTLAYASNSSNNNNGPRANASYVMSIVFFVIQFVTMLIFALWVTWNAREHTKKNMFGYQVDPIEHHDKSNIFG